MLQYFETLTDISGNSLLGATVQVLNWPALTPATIYTTNGTASPIAASTVSSDITGQVSFYAPDGAYQLVYVYKGTTYKTKAPVQLLDPMGFVDFTDTGAANAYVVTDQRLPTQLYAGLKVEFTAANSNSGASTFNLNATGAQPLTFTGGGALSSGSILATGIYQVEWDGAKWQLRNNLLVSPNYPIISGETGVTNTTYIYGDPRRQGVVGNGTNNDTTAGQNWLASGYAEGFLPQSLILAATQLTLVTSMKIKGPGGMKQLANPGVNSFFQALAATGGLSLELDGINFDGNYTAQGALPQNFTVDFRSSGSSATPTIFRVTRCNFVNGSVGDIRCFGNQTGGLITFICSTCTFQGGAQGDAGGTYFPRSIDVADAVDTCLTDSHFDLGTAPAAGRAGIVGYYYQNESIPTQFSSFVRAVVSGCSFNRMGRDQNNGQGSIDFYGYSIDVVITSNVIRNFACRAIDVKASDPRALIANNQVDGSYPGLNFVTVGIVCNGGTTNDFYNDLLILNNIVNGATQDGIFVNGFNVTSAAGQRVGVGIRNNIVRGCGSSGAGRDIAVTACTNVDISGNLMFSNGGSNAMGFNNCSGLFTIRNNQIVTPAGRGLLINGGDNNSACYFEVSDNLVQSPGFSGLGSGMYFSGCGGVVLHESNRFYNCGGTPINVDPTCVVTATITATNLLTVTAITYGAIIPGQVIVAPGAAAAQVSVPGITILAYGTGGSTGTGGLGTYQLSAAVTNVGSQLFNLEGQAFGTQANPKTITLNFNTQPPGGTARVTQNVHLVDSFGSSGAGILAWIVGGYPGMRVTLKCLSAARAITVYDNGGGVAVGNIQFSAVAGSASVVLNQLYQSVTLVYDGTFWRPVAKI